MVIKVIFSIFRFINIFYVMILAHDWHLLTEVKDNEETCVHAIINDDVDINKLDFLLLDEERKLIVKLKVTSREIYFCTTIGKPMFAQLGDDVKYVEGSGAETYKTS
jgi:hypothetical protein